MTSHLHNCLTVVQVYLKVQLAIEALRAITGYVDIPISC